MKIVITDAMRGKISKDGVITAWPDVDVTGRLYDKMIATQQRIDGTTFVVIPPGRSEHIEFDDSALHAKYGVAPERVAPSGLVTSSVTMEPVKLAATNAPAPSVDATPGDPTADLSADPTGIRKAKA